MLYDYVYNHLGGDGLSRMGSSGTTRGIPGRSMGYKLHFGRSRITDDDEYDNFCFVDKHLKPS
jgi:hypothetical protein